MTDPTLNTAPTSPECTTFERQLADYLDGTLAPNARVSMDDHHRSCAHCNALVRDLEDIVQQATTLPVMTPSRDLWPGIESRLDTTVIPLASRTRLQTPAAVTVARRTMTVRTFAIAAALLVAATSAVTWRLARVQSTGRRAPDLAMIAAPSVPSANAMQATDTIEAPLSVDSSVPVKLVASSQADVDAIYEREIASLRRVVNERFADLDSTTVSALRRNLAIIDAAIEDSRKALTRDPRSRLLSTQLDRALENKLALMRRVALL